MNISRKKKQVLVFMLAPPLPATAGGDIYAVNALVPFADEIDFHLFCYIGGEEDVAKIERHRPAYDQLFRSIHVERRPLMPFQMGAIRRTIFQVTQALRGMPFIDASYYSRPAVRAARRLVKRYEIDALEINSAHLAFFKKFLPKIPALLVGHNIEADIFPFWMPQGLVGWKLRLMEWISRRSRRSAHAVEIQNSFDFSVMTFISKDDMSRVTASVPKLWMPLSFARKGFPYEDKPIDVFNVLWMGGFGWYPNSEGVIWFSKRIFPAIQDQLREHNIILHFCGSNPPGELREIHDGENVFVHGFVNDIDTMLRDAHLLMVPLLSGGGIRVKIIEAMAAGVPVLSTAKGCEGIGAENGKSILIEDDPSVFGRVLVEASQQRERLRAISESALELIATSYSPEASQRAKRKAYELTGVA
ncbi:glycosyltransferase [Dyella ginsengisoli]|uniref:glycosyltransferase n=1 Tax=Dyella ginsengisoli TaxID=363848 RepID=UPI000A02C609|nr:glycosyltransferase [Dyella ginsengisoli]